MSDPPFALVTMDDSVSSPVKDDVPAVPFLNMPVELHHHIASYLSLGQLKRMAAVSHDTYAMYNSQLYRRDTHNERVALAHAIACHEPETGLAIIDHIIAYEYLPGTDPFNKPFRHGKMTGFPPLHRSIHVGNLEVYHKLTGLCDFSGWTNQLDKTDHMNALHCAVNIPNNRRASSKSSLSILGDLVGNRSKYGIDIDKRSLPYDHSCHGKTAIFIVLQQSVSEYPQEAALKPKPFNELLKASLKLLLDNGADPTKRWHFRGTPRYFATPLSYIIHNCQRRLNDTNLGMALQLIKAGAPLGSSSRDPVTCEGETDLIECLKKPRRHAQWIALVKALLEAGCVPKSRSGESALAYFLKSHLKWKGVRMDLKNGVIHDHDSATANTNICWVSLEIIDLLINHGCSLYDRDVNGMTPMHIAFGLAGNFDALLHGILTKFHPKVTAVTNHGQTPLHTMFSSKENMGSKHHRVKWLVDRGCPIDHADKNGWTAFHWFARSDMALNQPKEWVREFRRYNNKLGSRTKAGQDAVMIMEKAFEETERPEELQAKRKHREENKGKLNLDALPELPKDGILEFEKVVKYYKTARKPPIHMGPKYVPSAPKYEVMEKDERYGQY